MAPLKQVSLALGLGHFEYPAQRGVGHTQVERSVFGKITWRF